MTEDLQKPFDVGIAMVTVLRPTFAQALRSVYAQRLSGRIHVVVGIDRWQGERGTLEALIAERPSNVSVTVIDLGYSTSARHGGVYASNYGGALKTILSYAANSRYITYLDDDNWYAPDHLETMIKAIAGKEWAFSLMHFVEATTGEYLCPDTWSSLGPDRGVYAKAQGGFVDTNCFLIDKIACNDVFPEWAMPRFQGGTGGDRQILQRLAKRPYGSNQAHTVYYRVHLSWQHPYLLWKFRCAGVDLARFLPPEKIPDAAVWQRCADYDRQISAASSTTEPPPGPPG